MNTDFACGIDPYAGMRQRASGAAGSVDAGQVQGLHRSAFREAVAFKDGNAHGACRQQRGGTHRRPAHRHHAQ